MCNPMLAVAGAGAALSAGSVLANQQGAAAQESARNSAIMRNQTAQQQIQQQSDQLFSDTLNKTNAGEQGKNRQRIADERTAEDTARLDAIPTAQPITGSAPAEVGSTIARSIRGALDRGKVQARLNANVSAYGGNNMDVGQTLGRAGQWQSIFGNNMLRTAQLLPGELHAANSAGAGWRGAGAIGSALGGGAASAGLGEGAPTWGDLFGGRAAGSGWTF